MRFLVFGIAEGGNIADGKINVVGLGLRRLNVPSVPIAAPLTIAGMVDVMTDEAGTYDLQLTVATEARRIRSPRPPRISSPIRSTRRCPRGSSS